MLVDHDDAEVGRCPKLDAHGFGRSLLHRAVSAIVVRDDAVLVQQRAAAKYHFGGRWSNACCTHPRPGESNRAAVDRALGHELGLDAAGITYAGSFEYEAIDLESGRAEHELDHVYVVTVDRDARPNPVEAAAVAWLDAPALRDLLARGDVTPWFPLTLCVAGRVAALPLDIGPPTIESVPDLLHYEFHAVH